MANDTKHTEQVKINLTERELLDLTRLAALEDRTLSEYIRLTLRSSLYGKVSRLRHELEGSMSDYRGLSGTQA